MPPPCSNHRACSWGMNWVQFCIWEEPPWEPESFSWLQVGTADLRLQTCLGNGAGAILLLVAIDLFVSHGRFLPAAPSSLAPQFNVPPSVQFLQSEADPPHTWRITTLSGQGQRFLDANLGFYYGWHDLRERLSSSLRIFRRLSEL